MTRGGYRPGTGRPKGAKDRVPRKSTKTDATAKDKATIKQLLALGTKAKAKMYQEFLQRIGKGDTLSLAEKRLMAKLGAEIEAEIKPVVPQDTDPKDIEAADFLRSVWNDPKVEIALRIRAAEIVFKGDGEKKGKKDEKADRAAKAGAGKFAASAPPLRVVNRKEG